MLAGEPQRGPGLSDPGQPGTGQQLPGEAPGAADRRGHRHVCRDHRLGLVGCQPHGVDDRAVAQGTGDGSTGHLVRPEAGPHDQGARPGSQSTGRAEVEGDRQAGAPVRGEPVEEAAAPQPAGRPARHRTPGRKPRGLLGDALLREVVADGARDEQAPGRPAPARAGRLPPRRAGPARGVDRDRVDDVAPGRTAGVPAVHPRSLPGPGTACPASSTGTPGTLSPHASSSRSRTCER